MPELDEYSISVIEKINDMSRNAREELLLRAIDLPDFNFVDFSGAKIERDYSDCRSFVVAVYANLDGEKGEDIEAIDNVRINNNKLYLYWDNNGNYYKFYFRVPSYDEVRNGLPYFRNVYKI